MSEAVEEMRSWDYQMMNINDLAARLESSIEKGLTSIEAACRLVKNGPNNISPPPKPFFSGLFCCASSRDAKTPNQFNSFEVMRGKEFKFTLIN